MKISNKFLVYSFFSVLALTILLAISLRVHDEGNPTYYAAQSSANIVSNNLQESNNIPSLASPQATFVFNGFKEIEASGNWEIVIKRGDQYQVKVFADEQTLSGTSVKQNGDTLSLSMRDNWFGGTSSKIMAEISLPDLQKIDASGSAKISFSEFKGNNLAIDLSGSSSLDSQDNDFANVDIDSSGSSKIKVNGGDIANLSLTSGGSSEIDLAKSAVTNAKIDLSGASHLEINMAGGTLKGEVKGASSIVYSGNILSQEITTSGASSIRKR